jgi:hypothetical protein
MSVVLTVRLRRMNEPFNAMAALHEDMGTRESLAKLLGGVDENREFIRKQTEQIKELAEKMDDCYSGMGMVKYNAFEDIGGNQSYSICLLSRNRNGFILSNLVARNSARGYSIEVKNGAPSRELSSEESEALEQAIHSLKGQPVA